MQSSYNTYGVFLLAAGWGKTAKTQISLRKTSRAVRFFGDKNRNVFLKFKTILEMLWNRRPMLKLLLTYLWLDDLPKPKSKHLFTNCSICSSIRRTNCVYRTPGQLYICAVALPRERKDNTRPTVSRLPEIFQQFGRVFCWDRHAN